MSDDGLLLLLVMIVSLVMVFSVEKRVGHW
jgi:hypothetical protein